MNGVASGVMARHFVRNTETIFSNRSNQPNICAVYMNNFLEVISLNDRANILYDVLKLVLELFDQEDNTYDVTVTSASPLSEEQKTRLLTIVSQKFEIKTRRLVEKIDEELIGGFVIKAKNKFVDTSIRSQLQAFKMNLK